MTGGKSEAMKEQGLVECSYDSLLADATTISPLDAAKISKTCPLGEIEVCRFDIVQAEKRTWFCP
jgi:hypothetical protein